MKTRIFTRILALVAFIGLSACTIRADTVRFVEVDNSPSVDAWKIILPNGTLSKSGNIGTISLAALGGGDMTTGVYDTTANGIIDVAALPATLIYTGDDGGLASLAITSASDGTVLAVRRFSAGQTNNPFEVQTEANAMVFSVGPTGSISANNITTRGQTVFLNTAGDRFVKMGTGSPEAAVTGSIGSIWLASDGTTGTTLWIKESGTGNTGWVAVAPGSGGTPDDGSVTTAKFAAATLVTAADTIAANDNDTTVPTSAAVKDYADSLLVGGFDATAQDALTWSDGANASNAWTFNLSGTDPVLTAVSGGLTLTGTMAATAFSGPLTGDVTGNVSGSSGSTTGNAATATLAGTVTVVDSTDASSSVALFDSATGSLAPKTDAGLAYNATTGVLTATGFAGPITGNVTGDVSGNAGTATTAGTGDTATGFFSSGTIEDARLPATLDGKTMTNATISSGTATVTTATVGTLSFEGATADDFETSVAVTDPTADRTITLPNATGTVLLTDGSAASLTSFPTLNQNTTGSAATLTTARTLWGVSFNGSANIAGNIELGADGTTDTTLSRTGAGAIAVEGVAVLLSGGALGTPSSGVGTALTALNGENIQDDTIDDDSLDFGTGTDQISAADIPIADTGSIFTATEVEAALLELAKVPTKATAASYTVGTTNPREFYGGVIYVTAAATITIPAVADGASFTVITIGAVAVSVDPNAADLLYLNGTALADGDKITNASTTGDIAVFTYYDATGWYVTTNTGWTDTN